MWAHGAFDDFIWRRGLTFRQDAPTKDIYIRMSFNIFIPENIYHIIIFAKHVQRVALSLPLGRHAVCIACGFPTSYCYRLEAIATRLECIATKVQAIAPVLAKNLWVGITEKHQSHRGRCFVQESWKYDASNETVRDVTRCVCAAAARPQRSLDRRCGSAQ